MLTSSQIETRIALRERRLLDIRKSMQSQSEYILELLHAYTGAEELNSEQLENGVRSQLSTGITAGYSVYSLAYAEWLRLFVEAEGLGREIDQLESLLP